MFRILLNLMLIGTQLHAGSGVLICLCVKSDGSYCCVDVFPGLCNSDQKELRAIESDGGSCKCCHQEEFSSHSECGNRVIHDQSGCSRIPVLISCGQPTSVSRHSVSAFMEQVSALIALPLAFGLNAHIVAQPVLHWSDPPLIANFTLAVVSTVMIRC